MKKMFVSKILHTIVILSFLLPFFYTGCGGPSAEQMASLDSLNNDSISKIGQLKVDTTVNNLTPIIEIDTTDSITKQSMQNDSVAFESCSKPSHSNQNEIDSLYSDKLVAKHPYLSLILKPSSDTYTGLGAVFNMFELTSVFSLTFSFILLLIGLLIKFIDPSSYKTSIVLEIFIIIGILISNIPSWNCERLWGFWVALALVSILFLFDIYSMIKNKLTLTLAKPSQA